jgi:hypothetical protein
VRRVGQRRLQHGPVRQPGHRAGQDQLPAERAGGPGGQVVALHRGQPAQREQVPGGRQHRVLGQRGGQRHRAERLPAQRRVRPGQLRGGHPGEEDPAGAGEAGVEVRVLGQVPVQRLQHRRHRGAGRGQHRRADHLQVVVHQVDVAPGQPVQHRPHVRVRDAHHLVVRPGDGAELPGREGADVLVCGQPALPDRGQHHPVAAGAQLRDEGGHHVLDAAVVRWRHGQPGPGVHQHGQRSWHRPVTPFV